jgi:hypothetical protein
MIIPPLPVVGATIWIKWSAHSIGKGTVGVHIDSNTFGGRGVPDECEFKRDLAGEGIDWFRADPRVKPAEARGKCQTPCCTRDATHPLFNLCSEHAAGACVTFSSGSPEASKAAEAASAMRERFEKAYSEFIETSSGVGVISGRGLAVYEVVAFAAEEVRLALAPREQELARLREFARKVREHVDRNSGCCVFVTKAVKELDSAEAKETTK